MNVVRLGEIAESLPCDYGDTPVQEASNFKVVKVSNVSAREDSMANLSNAHLVQKSFQVYW